MDFNIKNEVNMFTRLQSCHIFESSEQVILNTWSYPCVTDIVRKLCLKKISLVLPEFRNIEASNDFKKKLTRIFRFNKQWFYIFVSSSTINTPEENAASQPRDIAIVLEASDFSIFMYNSIAEVMFRTYVKTGNPSNVLQQFLSLLTDGTCALPRGKIFNSNDFRSNVTYEDHDIKSIINKFGFDCIVIYTALLRRRRIAVYHHDIDVLFKVLCSLPYMLPSPEDSDVWTYLYPWVHISPEETSCLKDLSFYVCGTTDSNIESHTDLFDVLINIAASEITVLPLVKDSLTMNKTHKELASYMLQLAGDEDVSENEMVEELEKRSLSVMDKLIKTNRKNLKP